jgi:hypothetical protein
MAHVRAIKMPVAVLDVEQLARDGAEIGDDQLVGEAPGERFEAGVAVHGVPAYQ